MLHHAISGCSLRAQTACPVIASGIPQQLWLYFSPGLLLAGRDEVIAVRLNKTTA